ncbi:MAG TPA: Cof-type HAD-IIB family hydrolase [Candidatus Tetragenococcus pullicola]|nr:Cof-type HAD-IIB family hydrolase [Candidatus Tetragenococcus pullicola]
MTYQAIAFFDLDGTLLDDHSEVTNEVAEAMKQLQLNNVLPVIATGRTEKEIIQIREQAGISSNIVMNGAFVRVDGKKVYSEEISKSICERMIQAVESKNHTLSFYNSEKIWSTDHDDNLIRAYQFIHSQVPPIDKQGYKTQEVNMLLPCCQEGDDFYEQNFPELTFYRNGPYSIDTVIKGTSKGKAVKLLKTKLNLDSVPTFGFGDGPNDIALLEACDHKVAMGNAKPELKERADYITAANTKGGIVQALKHFDLI